MLKYFGYRKGINHLHVTQTLNILLLMLKLINLFFKKDVFIFNQFENTDVYNSGKQQND